MKKNYVKPSLLSETFVANNIMNGMAADADSFLSSGIDLYLNGQKHEGITFSDGNTLNSVSINDFNK
jgi:hypothetical protein